MTKLFESLCIGLGYILGAAGVLAGAVYLFCRFVDILLQRAGMTGLMLSFARQECLKSPRSFWARLFWGKGETE